MFDRIITITLNPALDVTINLDDFSFDEPVNATSEIIHSGGKSINVSRVLTALHVKNKAVGVIGKSNADAFCNLLKNESVDYDFIMCDGTIRENLTLVFPDKRIIKINRNGLNFDKKLIMQICTRLDNMLENTENALIVFAGSLPQNVSKDEYIKFIKRFESPKIKICLDTNFFSKEDIKCIKPYIIKPNLVEFEKLVGKKINSEDDMQTYAKEISPYCEHILVSLGKDGLFYKNGTQTLVATPKPVMVLSTVGAGDTTLAGFIKSINDDPDDIESAVLFSVSAGTASVKLEGTATVTLSQVEDVLKTTKLYSI